jgi:hypothetical protein
MLKHFVLVEVQNLYGRCLVTPPLEFLFLLQSMHVRLSLYVPMKEVAPRQRSTHNTNIIASCWF